MQDPATDTLAITPDGEPFRNDDGSLLLRPGGHGALLANLGALAPPGSEGWEWASWVLLKNVDNVQPEHAHELVAHWQGVLGGVLITIQNAVFDHLEQLSSAEGFAAEEDAAAATAARFLVEELDVAEAAGWPSREGGEPYRLLRQRLLRPLRVCGVVENRGEPGVARSGSSAAAASPRSRSSSAPRSATTRRRRRSSPARPTSTRC